MATKKEPTGKIKGTLIVDGQAYDCWAGSAEAITGAQAYLDGLAADVANAEAQQLARQAALDARNSELAAKDAQIAAIKREIEDTKAKARDQVGLIDRLVKERLQVIEDAKRVLPSIVTDGISTAQIMAAVVKAKHGDEAVAGRSDEYVAARFGFLVDSAKVATTDPFAAVVKDGLQPNLSAKDAAEQAYAQSVADLNNAWRTRH